MDFDRLRYLVAIAQTGSVRGAARELHVTPGAVSKALARLEAETGMSLITPDGRGIALTDDGRWLAGRGQRVVDEFAAIDRDRSSRTPREATLSLAVHDVFATWFCGLLARQFLPGVPLAVAERWPGDIEQSVVSGEADVGVTFVPVSTAGVEHVELARVRIGVYVRRGAFAHTQLADLPFVVPSHPVVGAARASGPLDGWPRDRPRTVAFLTSSLEAQLELARTGAAAVVVPDFVATMHNARCRAAQRLEPHGSDQALGRLSQRIHLVRRTGASAALARRADAVIAAVRAMCADA